MAKKPEPKPKPQKKMTAKEQSERFIQTARDIHADETGGEFEAALKKVVPPKHGGSG
jgi:hypothetical protein